jgi:maltooligosyltrehalose trehalohydrolase
MPAPARPLAAFCTLLAPFTPMLFMGEEYGELNPFQFFTDHIDEEIAVATREGRRAEFASFAAFAETVPDPEDPQTFERSKLSRGVDVGLARLYRELLGARRRLPAGEVDEIAFDENARWMTVRRDDWQLAMNFGTGPVRIPSSGGAIELSAGEEAQLAAGTLTLPAMSGALIR